MNIKYNIIFDKKYNSNKSNRKKLDINYELCNKTMITSKSCIEQLYFNIFGKDIKIPNVFTEKRETRIINLNYENKFNNNKETIIKDYSSIYSKPFIRNYNHKLNKSSMDIELDKSKEEIKPTFNRYKRRSVDNQISRIDTRNACNLSTTDKMRENTSNEESFIIVKNSYNNSNKTFDIKAVKLQDYKKLDENNTKEENCSNCLGPEGLCNII